MRPVLSSACVSSLACSTQTVRCDRHLTPINVPSAPVAEAPAPGSRAKRMPDPQREPTSQARRERSRTLNRQRRRAGTRRGRSP